MYGVGWGLTSDARVRRGVRGWGVGSEDVGGAWDIHISPENQTQNVNWSLSHSLSVF